MPQLDLYPSQPQSLLLAPISPREEALGMMADKKRKKWMKERGKKFFENNLIYSSILQPKWIE